MLKDFDELKEIFHRDYLRCCEDGILDHATLLNLVEYKYNFIDFEIDDNKVIITNSDKLFNKVFKQDIDEGSYEVVGQLYVG